MRAFWGPFISHSSHGWGSTRLQVRTGDVCAAGPNLTPEPLFLHLEQTTQTERCRTHGFRPWGETAVPFLRTTLSAPAPNFCLSSSAVQHWQGTKNYLRGTRKPGLDSKGAGHCLKILLKIISLPKDTCWYKYLIPYSKKQKELVQLYGHEKVKFCYFSHVFHGEYILLYILYLDSGNGIVRMEYARSYWSPQTKSSSVHREQVLYVWFLTWFCLCSVVRAGAGPGPSGHAMPLLDRRCLPGGSPQLTNHPQTIFLCFLSFSWQQGSIIKAVEAKHALVC